MQPPFHSEQVAEVFQTYPAAVQPVMLALRQLVFETADETAEVDAIEETLKWGEPSYLNKAGSTIRMDWKSGQPDQYAVYFHCKTTLVETFRELYPDTFRFEGNRAIIFGIDDEVPVEALKHCISLALTYHLRKGLPMLGV